MMARIIALIYFTIGLITAILDSLDILKLGLMSYQTNLCALSGDINCVSEGITKLVLFMVDIIIGPVLLAANFASNPIFGILGAFIAIFILWYFYIREQ